MANDSIFEFLRLVSKEFPELTLCLSTNGLNLAEKLDLIEKVGIRTLTITINALNVETAEKIYSWIMYGGKILTGKESAEIFIRNQLLGLRLATEKNLYVKVNTVLVQGINENEILQIAKVTAEYGANFINIIPLIPNGKLSRLKNHHGKR